MPKCELLDPNMYWGGVKHHCGDVLDLTLDEIAFVESLAPRQRLKVLNDQDRGESLIRRDEDADEGNARLRPDAGIGKATAAKRSPRVQRKPPRRKGSVGPGGAMGA